MRKLLGKGLRCIGLYGVATAVHNWFVFCVWWHLHHHRKTRRFYAQFMRPGDLVFDVGANLGARARIFLELGARVVCVEPQAACLRRLHALFDGNERVTIVETALGACPGEAVLHVSEQNPGITTMTDKWMQQGSRFAGETWNKTESVPVTTLDALIKTHGQPVFCKIDVEGFELQVLKGLSRRIGAVSIEYSREFHDDAVQCMRRLAELGPVTFNFSQGDAMQLAWSSWTSAAELCDRLKGVVGEFLWGDIYARFG